MAFPLTPLGQIANGAALLVHRNKQGANSACRLGGHDKADFLRREGVCQDKKGQHGADRATGPGCEDEACSAEKPTKGSRKTLHLPCKGGVVGSVNGLSPCGRLPIGGDYQSVWWPAPLRQAVSTISANALGDIP